MRYALNLLFSVFVGLAVALPGQAALAAGAKHKHMMAHAKAAAAAPAADLPPANPNCAYGAPSEEQLRLYARKPFAEVPPIRSVNGVLTATLTVGYADNSILGCPVHLRSYNGGLIGPTLRVKPGDTMRIRLVNSLPRTSDPCPMHNMENEPGGFNLTNLHTHGLHVSPSGNSDNVFLQVCPGGPPQDYEIHIPMDQPPGTHWYHAHLHGSTALQVSSGMEGAIIVEGGQDTIPQIAAAQERVMVLQQIAYDDRGVIESYDPIFDFDDNGRVITVNGQVMPVIAMQPGQVEHWRLVDAGVAESMPLYVSNGQPNSYVPLYEIATDGNAMGRKDVWTSQGVELEPGYRTDILFKAPPLPAGQQSVTYFLTTKPIAGVKRLQFADAPRATPKQLAAAYNGVAPPQTVAIIVVGGTLDDMALPTDAQLAPFMPFQPITDSELTGRPQTLNFMSAYAVCPGPGRPCTVCDPDDPKVKTTCKFRYMVDMIPYTTARKRTLTLNKASQWSLTAGTKASPQAHPFHIHVNPFEMERTGPDGMPETVWKDTVLVTVGDPQAPLTLKSRYVDFTGEFVLHCHILTHEDQGMMENVEIVR